MGIMDDSFLSIYMLHCFEEGIVPLRNGDRFRSPEEVIADLEKMSPKEARKAKRKYRKMWRKLRRHGEEFVGGVEKIPRHIRRGRVDRKMLTAAGKTLNYK
jgi:hypothetical protein